MIKHNLYSDILYTSGYSRNLLLDSLNEKIYFIDRNLFSDKIFQNINLAEIPETFQRILLENDLIFETTEDLRDAFPPISKNWNYPFGISNALIYVTIDNCNNIYKINDFFEIAHFNFIFTNDIDINAIIKLFNFLKIHPSDTIEFTFIEKLNEELFHYIELKVLELNKIVIISNYAKNTHSEVEVDKQYISNRLLKNLNPKILKFSRSLLHFNESQEHHTYFNRKICISEKGEFKNAPESTRIFGNFNSITSYIELVEIINKLDFQEYWFVKMDNTDVCKDCEFRNICIDNRLPVERDKNEWFHDIECEYNPYIAKWKDDEGYQTLAECGVISNEKGFSIDNEKISNINSILWDEEEVKVK